MENEVRRHFDEIIEDAKTVLEDVEIKQDYSVKRALLKISGNFGKLKVRITEVIDIDKRKYAYYLINRDLVVIGFDNAPDINALKIKYGKDYVHHLDERIPHFHGKGKKNTELTKEISFREFLEKIKSLKSDKEIENKILTQINTDERSNAVKNTSPGQPNNKRKNPCKSV